jgi:hypothetical protein
MKSTYRKSTENYLVKHYIINVHWGFGIKVQPRMDLDKQSFLLSRYFTQENDLVSI